MYQPPGEFLPGQRLWAFCKVTEDAPDTVLIRFRTPKGTAQECTVQVEKTDAVPKQFRSTKGTTDAITVNDRAQEEAYWKKQMDGGLEPAMHLLYIEPSSACNLRCQYCMASDDYERIDRGNISQEVFDAALEAVRQMPEIQMLQLHAFGEPLINPHFCDMLRRIAKETHIRQIGFFTNGTLLTRQVSDQLAHIPLRMRIVVSIDGNTPQENDAQRRGAHYQTIRENLLYFLKKIKHREKVVVQINNVHLAGEYEDIYVPKYLLEDFGFIEIDSHRAYYYTEMADQFSRQNIRAHEAPNKKICKRVFWQTTIRSNGDVVPCCWFSASSMVMGNVLEQPLKEIWQGEKYRELRARMAPDVPLEELPKGCRTCYAMNDSYLYTD